MAPVDPRSIYSQTHTNKPTVKLKPYGAYTGSALPSMDYTYYPSYNHHPKPSPDVHRQTEATSHSTKQSTNNPWDILELKPSYPTYYHHYYHMDI